MPFRLAAAQRYQTLFLETPIDGPPGAGSVQLQNAIEMPLAAGGIEP